MRKSFFVIVVSIMFFTGCMSMPLKTKMSNINKIGVLQIYPIWIDLPAVLLVEADLYQSFVDEKTNDLKIINENRAKELTEFYVEQLNLYTGKETIAIPKSVDSVKNHDELANIAAAYNVDMLILVDYYMLMRSTHINIDLKMRNDVYIFDAQGNLTGKKRITSSPVSWNTLSLSQYETTAGKFRDIEKFIAEYFTKFSPEKINSKSQLKK